MIARPCIVAVPMHFGVCRSEGVRQTLHCYLWRSGVFFSANISTDRPSWISTGCRSIWPSAVGTSTVQEPGRSPPIRRTRRVGDDTPVLVVAGLHLGVLGTLSTQ